MPFCVEPDHTPVGFFLLIYLSEIMQFRKGLELAMRPRIEGYALASFRSMIAPSWIETPEHPAVAV
jgi:hypothetical protein